MRARPGKNTVITATDGAVNLSAESSQKDIAMAGDPSLSGGATTAIGGTIGVGMMDANSLVVVAEGAKITGNAINATAKNDISHTNIAVAASSGTTNGIDVMVAYMEGDSNSVVSIDDEAKLTATRSASYASAEDEAKKNYSGAVNIGATNDTSVIAIGGALGIGTGAGVGVGASITNFDRYNYAAIADNDYTGASVAGDSETDKEKKLKQATAKKLNRLQYTIENNMGTSDVNAKKSLLGAANTISAGSINATDLTVNAATGGQIVNVAVAGGVSTGDDDPTPNIFDKFAAWKENTTNKITEYFDAIDNALCVKISSISGDKTKLHDVLNTNNQPEATATEKQSGLSIAGAGSVAVNVLNGDTAALINDANINITTVATDDIIKTNGVAVKAADDALAVAASGAAAISWKNRSKEDNSTGKSAAIAGEVGLNMIDSTVLASIADSKINNAAAITNSAEKTGATIAAGLSLALSREASSQTSNAAAAGSVSVNIVDSDVYAVMQDNTVDETGKAKTAITNAAYDNDIEITGGLNASISTGGAKANAVGATVSYASLTNDVQSAIIGGSYKGISTTDVTATTNETIVGVAAGIGVAAGSSTSSLALEGSAAYNKVDNYANAKVEGATMSGESLNVAAYDTAERKNAHESYIAERGFDADGSSYTAAVTGAANDIRGDKDQDGKAITQINTKRGGNTIVTGALSVTGASSGGTSGGSAQGAVSVSDIDNDYNATIKDSTITMSGDTVGTSVNAASNSILVGFGVGAGGSNGKASLGGSVSYEMTDNDVTATIENSKIYTPATSVTATSGALEVNVAGQLNVSTGGSGAGAALAYNALNNTTGAYVYGSTLTGISGSETTISVDAANTGQVYSVGASLALSTSTGSTGSALGGVAVVNTGKSDVEAVVDESENKTRSSIKNAKSINVKSSDSSSRLAVIGNVTASADRVSLGGSVAINDIGTLTKGKQSNKAAINNTDITTTTDGTVAVTAVDEASLTTVSVGTAVSAGGVVAGTGAGAATLLEKETLAELAGTTINSAKTNSGNITVAASTDNAIQTVGVVLAANTGEAAAGVGVAVNKLTTDTNVAVNNAKANAKNFTAEATSDNSIKAIGIGGAAAKEAGVAGNIAVNLIASDTQASLKGASINATGNIGVLANSHDSISNYGGAIGVAAMGPGGAGVGISVAYDEISGTTASTVDSSTLTALGSDADSTITLTEYTKDTTTGTDKEHRGLVVDATAEHTIDGIAISAGAAATSTVSIGVAGTVTVNKIKGATNATVNNTAINSGAASLTSADVHVGATDRSKSASYVGALAGAIGGEGGGALGGASDTEIISRDVTASIANDSQKTLNGAAVDVTALNKADATTQSYGVAIAAGGVGAGALSGTVSTARTSGTTRASVAGATGKVGSLAVDAAHRTDINLVSAAGAVAAAIGSGAAGAGIGIVNDDSTTVAELAGSSIEATGDIAVDATNTTTATTKAVGIAASVGAAGINVAVNNLNNKVAARVNNSTLVAGGSFTELATNTIDTNFTGAANSAGGIALAVGVGVNTIDTGVVAELNNSTVSASSAKVNATEKLDIDNLVEGATLGFGGFNANAAVTSIGTTLASSYSSGDSQGASLDTSSVLSTANGAVSERDSATSANSSIAGTIMGNFTGSDGKALSTAAATTASAGTANGEGVQIKLTNASISTTGNTVIGAARQVDANITSAQAAISAASGGSASVAVLDIERQNAITINGSTIKAKSIGVTSNQSGTSSIDAYQVAASGALSLSAAYAATTLSGHNTITIGNSTLQASGLVTDDATTAGTLNVVARDTTAGTATVHGVTAGSVAGGVLITNVRNSSDTDVVLNNTGLIAAADAYETTTTYDSAGNVTKEETTQVGYTNSGVMTIAALKENTLKSIVNGGAVGAYAAQGLIANAADSGSARLTINGANRFLADDMMLTTINDPIVQASANAYTLSLLGGAGASIATASATGASRLTIGTGSSFTGGDVYMAAISTSQWQEDKKNIPNASAKTTGNNISVKYGAQANVATATSDIKVGVDVAESAYDVSRTLTITGINTSMVDARAEGLNIGGLFGSGSNVAISKSNVTTDVSAHGAKSGSSLGAVYISGRSYVDADNNTQGYGGGIVTLSPLAAHSDNTVITNTTVNLGGNWEGATSLDALAVASDDVTVTADSVNATVIGASGTEIDNEVKHNSVLNVTGTVTTTGAQNYQANNTVDHDVDLKGSGYGGATVAGTVLNNDVAYKAAVNLNKANLSGTGDKASITVLADTSGKMDYDNVLKSAGVVAMTNATSTHSITYDNAVNVTGATLKTAKENQDITIATTDDTDVDMSTAADTQGGYIGAASAVSTAKFTRSNKVAIDKDSQLVSTNDVNIYAGASTSGASADLTYNHLADAYNKTLIPVWSDPTVNNTMTQSNQVSIAGDVESVRHVNLKAGKGATLVTTSAREYNLYTGDTGGTGSVTSTVLGEQAESETTDNYVDIAASGKVLAGIHDTLNVTINGAPTIKVTDEDNGTIDYSGITADITSGSDWFSDAAYTGDTVTISNSLYARYTELTNLLGQYSKNSKEYESLLTARDSILKSMESSGFATKVNGVYYVSDTLTMPAIELNDLVISGGNITIDADNLKGSGKLTAKTAGELSVTNNTGLYLKVNDLAIKDKGGSITYNNVNLADAKLNNFSGTVASAATSTVDPNITVVSNGDKIETTYNGAKYTASMADIGIAGSITNAAGDITIKNSKHDITVAETASINGRNVSIQADNGNVTQISDGITFIGTNPIAKYQINTDIAKIIQSYISGQAASNSSGSDSRSFGSYDDYVNWITAKPWYSLDKSTVGLTSAQIQIANYLKEQYKDTNNAAGSIVAGKNIYITAKNVNLDGLVQSGYQNYKVALDSTAQKKIKALADAYDQNRIALTDQDVMNASNDKYCITTNAGAYYNATTKQYEYNVKVYYNPESKALLTETIAPDGGQVYITGAISSTGNGRILAMNGTPDISIDTSAVANELKVNSIANKNITGYISINDTQQGKRTEYTTDGTNITTTVTRLNSNGSLGTPTTTTVSGTKTSTSGSEYILSTSYSLPGNMTISWTGGTAGTRTVTKKQYQEKCLLWGAIKWGKTEDFVANKDVQKGQVTLSVTRDSSGKALDTGVVIGTKSGLTNNLTIKTTNHNSGSKEYSPVTSKTKYDSWYKKMIGYGNITYTWTETQGSSQSTTYDLKANSPVTVGFLGGSTGDISIKAAGDVSINGNVASATAADGSAIGNITLTSTSGKVQSIGDARVDADTLNVSAASGIDLNHGTISGTSTIAMTSTTGSVKLESDKGNLVFTGASGAKNGNLDITAAGSITTADGASLNGTRIDLTSKGSSINALVAAATSAVSSDSRAASINANAYGDITLTNTNGDMRLGQIQSTTGDVTLTTSGSFVDAIGDGSLSDADSKVARWQEMGLVSSADAADSRTAAAAAAKAERVSALESSAAKLASENGKSVDSYKSAAAAYASDSTLTSARETYLAAVEVADGDETKIANAYRLYQEAEQSYFSGKGYTSAEQEWIASYAAVSTSDSYGWSQNDLLYAVQESIINSKPGQVYTTDTPNVVGKNITLNAGSSIGIDGEQADIAYSDLTKLENLKILAGSKAGDLTWNDEQQIVSVRQQQPITVQLGEGGKLNLNANTSGAAEGGNVYLAGVKNTKLDISGTINTTKDVKLLADKGITMADGTIIANNLIIMGGSGDIGSEEKNIETNLSGTLEANSSGSIYIHQKSIAGEAVNPLTILSIAAGNLYLTADNGMRMTTESGKTAGYINGKLIVLKAENGDIGVDGDGLRIAENGAVVNATATNGNVYLAGSGAIGNTTLDTIVAGGGTVSLDFGGSLAQDSTAGGIKAATLNVTTGGGQTLLAATNTASTVNIAGKKNLIGGDLAYTGTADNLVVNIADDTIINGAAAIVNAKNGGTLGLTGDIVSLGGDITISADGSITGRETSVINKGAGTITVNSTGTGDIDLKELIARDNIDIDVNAGDLTLVNLNGNIIALRMGKKGANVDIDNITMGRRFDISGININNDKLIASYDTNGTLVYRQKDGTKPICVLTFGDIDDANGVRFEQLWVNNANMQFNTDNISFNKLLVKDVAHITDSSGHTTAVWGGSRALRDGSDVSYWQGPRINSPLRAPLAWNSDGTTNYWMYLNISGKSQTSNGVLLMNKHYSIAGYAGLDDISEQLSSDATEEYRAGFDSLAKYYLRYDLCDYTNLLQGLNAGTISYS